MRLRVLVSPARERVLPVALRLRASWGARTRGVLCALCSNGVALRQHVALTATVHVRAVSQKRNALAVVQPINLSAVNS
jgi:hypothetical protein